MDLNNQRTGKDATKPRALGLLGHSGYVNMFLVLTCKSYSLFRQREGDLTQSYDKSPYTNRNVKGAK